MSENASTNTPAKVSYTVHSSNGVNVIKVSSKSRSTAVAGAIAGVIRDVGQAVVQAIGASAVNQAVKAIAIARGYLEEDGLDISCKPTFTEVEINGQERTAVRFLVVAEPLERNST